VRRAGPAAVLVVLLGCPDAEFAYPTPAPRIVTFTATPFAVTPGAQVDLRWAAEGAEAVTLEGLPEGILPVPAAGRRGVRPEGPLTLTLTARGPGGQRQARLQILVTAEGPARITALEVSPAAVRAGAPVRVRWATEGARAVSLYTTDGAAAGEVAASGAVVLRPTADTEVVLRAEGAPAPVEARRALRVIPEAPRVATFTAEPNPATAGAGVQLSAELSGFSVARLWQDGPEGPTLLREVVRADQLGADPFFFTHHLTDLPVGSTGLRLVLSGVGGQVEDTLTVTVRPAGLPRIEALTVTPTVTGPGGEVWIRWRAADVARLDLAVDGRTQRDLPLSGERLAVVTRDQDVLLTGLVQGGGTVTAQAPVRVDPARPAIVDLAPLTATGTAAVGLAWVVQGADRVVVSDDAGFTASSTLAGGLWTWPAARPVAVRFRAEGEGGATERHLSLVAGPRPQITQFSAPGGLARVGRWVPFTWATTDASRVRLTAFRADVRVAPSGAQAVLAEGFGTAATQLEAVGLGGEASSVFPITTFDAGDEGDEEPNDTFELAASPFGTRPAMTLGELTEADVDVYVLPATSGRMQVELSAPLACPAGVTVEVWRDLGPDGAMGPVVVRDTNLGACPRLDDAETPELGDVELPWFLVVRSQGATPGARYTLRVSDQARVCGDGILDVHEGCDDGNATGGDGCSSACLEEDTGEAEPNDAVETRQAWPGAPLVGSLSPRDVDLFSVVVPPGAGGPRGLRLSPPGAGLCGLEARLQVFGPDADLRADSGVAPCPALAPEALVLEPGVYTVQITPGPGRHAAARGRYVLEWSP
jgi:cysteine-rich repeat protein